MEEIAKAITGTAVILIVVAFVLAGASQAAYYGDTSRLYGRLAWIAFSVGAAGIIASIWLNALT